MSTVDVAFDVSWLSLLATVLLPMITALVTNRLAHPGLKAGILALLALVTGVVNDLLVAGGSGSFNLSDALATSLIVFLGAVGLHYGLLKPTNITGSQGAIARGINGGVGSSEGRAQPGEPRY